MYFIENKYSQESFTENNLKKEYDFWLPLPICSYDFFSQHYKLKTLSDVWNPYKRLNAKHELIFLLVKTLPLFS